jgi:putative transposase
MDFVLIPVATYGEAGCLTITDAHSCCIRAIYVCRSEDVVHTLERICKPGGYPRAIRIDVDRAFISRDLSLWAYRNNVRLEFSGRGKPLDKGFIERYVSELRATCLDISPSLALTYVGEKLEAWRLQHNERARPAIECTVSIAQKDSSAEISLTS